MAKRFACRVCGHPMRKRGLVCKACRRARPDAAKATVAFLSKALGRKPEPVRIPAAAKAKRPVCPNPSCGVKGVRGSKVCPWCGTAYSTEHQVAASAKAAAYQAKATGAAAWIGRAGNEHNPHDREMQRGEALKAAGGLMRGVDRRLLGRAARDNPDPHVREILRAIAEGRDI